MDAKTTQTTKDERRERCIRGVKRTARILAIVEELAANREAPTVENDYAGAFDNL